MWYRVFRSIVVFILRAFFQLKVEGLSNLPQKTNFIIVANHTSYIDPFVVGAAIPRKIYWIAMKDLYKVPLIKWFLYKVDTMPVGSSADKLIYLLDNDKNVGLFPEGTRTHDGQLRDFRRGAAVIAMRTGRPIVPCAIIGAHEAYPVKAKFPRLFMPITVRIGRPQYLLKEFENAIDDIRLQEGMLRVRNSVKEMINA